MNTFSAIKKNWNKISAKISGSPRTGDLSIAIFVAILVIFGTVMIFSASYYPCSNNNYNPYYFLRRQLMWAVIGAFFMWGASKIDYHVWARLWVIVPIICMILLILVLTPLGSSANGSQRWLVVGPITIMPGELAKIGIILFIVGYFSRHPKWSENFLKGSVAVAGVTAVFGGLIMLQPNMSTAFTIVAIAGGMLLVAGAKWKHLFSLGGLGFAAGLVLIFADSDGYRLARATSFLDPFEDALGDGWQVVQSLLALGSGGLTGVGLGNSVQKTLYLPYPQNDFILAIIGEELGFVGIFCLMCVFLLLIWRGCHIAMNAKDFTGMLLAAGITMMIGIQVIINIAVVTSCMPPTGVILPFISYGGNALLIFMGIMGILINISKQQDNRLTTM